jgi:hypothetical protein
MAGDGVFVRGRNGHFQIDSQFLQPIVIEESTASVVQYVDWGAWGTFPNMYWSNSWNTGNFYSMGLSEISLPQGYTAGDVLIFAKPSKYNRTYKLGIRYNDAGTSFQFIAPESFTGWDRDSSAVVEYIICSTRVEDAPPASQVQGYMGFQVRNEYNDVIYDSDRKTFLGEGVVSGNPGVERWWDYDRYGNPRAIEGLGMRRKEDLRRQLIYNHPNRTKEANEDTYVLMDPTSMISSDQCWGNVYHPRGPKCEHDEWWCFIEWYYKDSEDLAQNEDNLPQQTITMITERRVTHGDSPGPLSQAFIDHRPTRTLLVGRFQ